METFGPAAGAEALFRAFLAEHDHDRFAARFWLRSIETSSQTSGAKALDAPSRPPKSR
jgi:hypothetical protein